MLSNGGSASCNVSSCTMQPFCCFSRWSRGSLLRQAGPASRLGAGRHGATSPRGQVCSATSPCERRTLSSWTPSGDSSDYITPLAGRAWKADVPSQCRQAILSGCLIFLQARGARVSTAALREKGSCFCSFFGYNFKTVLSSTKQSWSFQTSPFNTSRQQK